jgi:hypothetical protein
LIAGPLVPAKAGTQCFAKELDTRFRGHQRTMVCAQRLTMPKNLSIETDLLDEVFRLSGERTKKAAVTKALQEFIARRRQKGLLDLVGKLEWDSSYDYKTGRSCD